MNFKQAKTKSKRIRRERTLLFLYAIAVTAALFISIYNNNSVKASINYNETFLEEMPDELALQEQTLSIEESLKFKEEETLPSPIAEEETTTIENVQKAEAMISPQNIGTSEEIVIVQKGDTFIDILTKLGLEYSEATKIYQAYKKVYDARKIKEGQEIQISSVVDGHYENEISITKISTEPTSGTRYILEKNTDGVFEARVEQDELINELKHISGSTSGILSNAMKNAGVPQNVIGNFISIFNFRVDFRRDIRAGDKFELLFERKIAPNGTVVKTGDIVYAALILSNKKIELYRYKDSSGTVDYYDEQGSALKKFLDRKPLEFKNARISSKFGKRFHPILKQYRLHSGVDYAAPMNTKVYASGDGMITAAKWVGGYGNYITIRHNSEYSTGYGHLKSYASGIRPGVRVRQGQVIGYVGSTGRSTGPHLHFEIIRNGKKIDPLKVKAATGENLSGAKLKEFKTLVAQIKENLARETKLAEQANLPSSTPADD
ncbi:MAG: peptidoglycan DD-metalloendopeptidase family protein [Alphaproteobacteria bacterium]|nr:peptidoglycan DD-metalloendopeptidase family protein [Alphaproteobacteria bacterium]